MDCRSFPLFVVKFVNSLIRMLQRIQRMLQIYTEQRYNDTEIPDKICYIAGPLPMVYEIEPKRYQFFNH